VNTPTELHAEARKIAVQAHELLNSITAENRSDEEAEFDRMMADADAYESRSACIDSDRPVVRTTATATARFGRSQQGFQPACDSALASDTCHHGRLRFSSTMPLEEAL